LAIYMPMHSVALCAMNAGACKFRARQSAGCHVVLNVCQVSDTSWGLTAFVPIQAMFQINAGSLIEGGVYGQHHRANGTWDYGVLHHHTPESSASY